METGKWTDEEMIQVYDLQERYTECVVDFVRHGFEGDVFKFLQLIPVLNGYEQTQEQDIFRRAEFIKEYGEEFEPQGRYIYKDLFNQWEGADTLREVFEEKYQWEFTEAHPASLALFAGSKEIAMESYTIEQYDRIRNEIPFRLMDRVQELIEEYPREIQDKACQQAIYGYSNVISSNGTTKSPFTNANELFAYIVLKLMYRTPFGGALSLSPVNSFNTSTANLFEHQLLLMYRTPFGGALSLSPVDSFNISTANLFEHQLFVFSLKIFLKPL